VSAAAGSGKTATLTRRIVEMLSEPDGPDAARLAVVTFTKLAAAELEERLTSALTERVAESGGNAHLTRQLFRLSSATISTIHSLAFSLVKEYRRNLGLGETLRVGDASQTDRMQEEAAREAVRELFREERKSSAELDTLYSLFGGTKGREGLTQAILSLQKCYASYPGGIAHLEARYEESAALLCRMKEADGSLPFFLHETPVGRRLYEDLRESLEKARLSLSCLLKEAEPLPTVGSYYVPDFEERLHRILQAQKALDRGEMTALAIHLEEVVGTSLPTVYRLKKCPPTEQEKKEAIHDYYNEKIKKELKKLLSDRLNLNPKEIISDWEQTLAFQRILLDLTANAEERFTVKKREKGVVDYTDLEHMTLSLLAKKEGDRWVETPLTETIRKKFDAVFVDEYQDTNRVQDLIFSFLAPKGHLFIVGDPKQSIYRFRGADPSIFAKVKNEMPLYGEEGEGMKKIFLSENFRCDRPVIDLVNRVFSEMMDSAAPDSLYGEADRLRYAKTPDPDDHIFPAELILVNKENREEEEETEAMESREATVLAQTIRKLLKGEEKKRGQVPFSPGDIAVICRTAKQIGKVRRALESCGIPCFSENGEDPKEEDEYLFVTSLIQTLANPIPDIPLLATLSSPVFRMEPDALYRIRKSHRKVPFYSALVQYGKTGSHEETRLRAAEAVETLRSLREEALNTELTEFLYTLYRRFQITRLFSREGRQSGAMRDLFLRAAENARSLELSTLGEFASYLERTDFPPPVPSDDCVRIMTIHKSKGLEFAVVFVSFLGQAFHLPDERATMIVQEPFGITLSLPKLGGRAKMTTVFRRSAKSQMHRDALEEEKRILYVALTRAKVKLYLTGTFRSEKSAVRNLMPFCADPLSPALTRLIMADASSPLDLILLSLRSSQALRACLEGEALGQEEAFSVRRADPLREEPEREESAESTAVVEPIFTEEILASLDYAYPHRAQETLPNKLSVSQILKERREEEAPEFYPIKLLDFEKGRLVSGAEKIGTATHQIMQFADPKALAENPEREFARLTKQGFLSEEDMALVRKDQILQFLSSDLFRKWMESPHYVREKRFNVLLDAHELGLGDGEVLVQGVVDAWFENSDGTLTLLDFKTDRVKEADGEALLRQRHGDQLRLYAAAIEKITQREVSALYLYSFHLGKTVLIPRNSEKA